jgi:diguanylate cyclase (GGDEF)-like protein
MLKAVAEELASHVRASDVVARLGGDEFGVLMWNAGKPQALMRARDLEMRIEELPVLHGTATLSVGASIGIAMLSGELDAAVLIDMADRDMYARKAERR